MKRIPLRIMVAALMIGMVGLPGLRAAPAAATSAPAAATVQDPALSDAEKQFLAKDIADLHSDDPKTLDEAFGGLVQLGPKAAGALDTLKPLLLDSRFLSYPSYNITGHTVFKVNQRVVNVLRCIGRAAIPPLISGLENKDEDLRGQIVGILAFSPADPAINAKLWIGLLGDSIASVRITAATQLGKLKEVSAVDPLCKTLTDQDQKVRIAAAEALGAIGDSKAIAPLIARLSDPETFVGWAAGKALGKLGAPAVEAVVGKFDTLGNQARIAGAIAIRESGAKSIKDSLLRQCLTSEHWELRGAATCAFATLKTPEALPTVAGMAEDENWNVRFAATCCLGQMADIKTAAEIRPILMKVMKNDKEAVNRSEALWSIYMLPDAPPVDFWKDIEAAAQDESPRVRHDAATTCDKFWDPKLVPALTRLLQDSSAWVRQEATVPAGDRKVKEVIPSLISLLDDADLDCTKGAAMALGKIGTDAAIDALVRKVQDAKLNLDRRKAVLYGLYHTKNPKAIEPLITAAEQYLDNPQTLTALKEMTGQDFRHDEIGKWREWYERQKVAKPIP